MSIRAHWLLFSAVSVLAACGGGGDDAPPPGQQPGSAPVTVDDAAATVTGQPVTIPVLTNDTDPDGPGDIDPATVVVTGVTHGTTAVNNANGDVTFTPDDGFTGNAGFNYAVSDRSGNRSQPARVTVAVNAPSNAAPAISDISDASIAEDGTTGRINFTVSDADTSAQNLTVTAESSNPVLVPGSGLVLGGTGTKRHLTVTPAPDQAGTATITVRVSDGTASASDSFLLTVTAVNDAPVISDVPDQAIDEDTATGDLAFTVGDIETPADALTVTATSDNAALVPASGLTLGGSGADRTVRVQPAAEQSGTATITLTVRDAEGLEAASFFTVTVASVNDAPTISDVTDQTIAEDTSTEALEFTVGDAETGADALTVAATSSNEALVPAAGLTLGGSGAQRTVRAQPLADQSGTTTITLTVSDADGGQASDSFVLTVTGVNDRPVAHSASVSGDEDKALTGQLSASDVDSASLTFKAARAPAHGTVTVETTGAFAYTPAANYAGGDSFTFVASDGVLDSEPATVTITLTDTAEPELGMTGPGAVDEDAGNAEFHVSLSRAPDAPVTVHYQTADDTARAGSDYTATSGDLQFTPAGETEFVVRVPVTDDAFDENNESLSLRLSVTAGADGVDTSGGLEVFMTIADDDTSNLLRIGAARRSVKPSQAHIDGIIESRIAGTERTQKFNLGGFGVNPTQSLPNPADQLGEALTQPAEAAVFSGSRGEEPIQIRAMVMEQRDGETVMFVMLDAIGAGNIIQQGVKNAVTAVTGIPPENILFGQTHTHAGPDLQGLWGGVPEDWVANTLYRAAAEVAAEAFASRRAARLTLAQGHTVAFNNYRRPRIDPDADADGTLTLLKAVGDDGTPVGTILQYNAHPTSINENPRAVHADYIQGAMDWVEEKAGGIGLYYNGPIADASGSGERADCPKAAGDGDYGNVRCRGEGIADAALALAERELAPTLVADEREVILPITNPAFLAVGAIGGFNRYYNFMQQVPVETIPGIGPEAKNLPQLTPTATTLVSRITIGGAAGGLEIVTIPGEATNSFGQYIRGLAKTNVMLLGLTHNSFGYILPEEEFSYVDQEGDDGLVAPFTGYEENVSLGPLTAPLLRTQGYNPLFAADPAKDIPPALADCFSNSESAACIVQVLENRLDKLVADVSVCVENGLGARDCPLRTALDMTVGTIADGCRDFGGPEEFCAVFDAITGTGAGEVIPDLDVVLVQDAALAQTAGCDPLDPANCLYPFPNDWFTAPAAPGSIQSTERGGTGRRVNIHPAATPRNSAGKPVDPSEWNRSDGFSPGALVTTFVPGLSLEQTFGRPSHELGVANVGLSQADDAPILVLEVQDDGSAPVKHLVWSEIDQNANQLTIVGAPLAGTFEVPGVTNEHGHVQRPLNDGRAALLIRPARNFAEGKRYVVVLRNLKDRYGRPILPQAGFRACLRGGSTLPPIQARCDQLAEKVVPVLDDAGIALDDSVFLAWDFTVESTESAIGRLRHMRDDAFATLSANPVVDDCTQLTAANAATCAAPGIVITGVTENPQNGIKRRIQGTISVPNYLAPVAPAPLDDPNIHSALNQFCANAPDGDFAEGCADFRDGADIGQGATLPSRLFYSPADGTPAPDPNNALDPTGLRYGDGLPDRNGTMTARFLCQIPAQATPDNPARASLYGHGQLDRAVAITYEGTPDVAREHNYMFCAVDWLGFRTGDAPNVVSSLVDLSNFPVIPDASQQGMLNFLFLARAMQHPQGFGALPEFQDPASGRPVFDRGEIFYNGNSQGGIFGGVVLAASKDVNRGVLGSLGMNYSTLLTRSKNFDEFAGVLYASYTDPLDRQLLFSMMQMLWDRSENNGYASHIIDNSAFGGPTNVVKLDTMFGDPQVTMYSAEVMARTMGVPFDNRQTLHVETLDAKYLGVNGRRHPAVEPYVGLELLEYGTAAAKGSALVVWDTNRAGDYQPIPPVENKPPRPHVDNHDASQKAHYGRCHMAHFLRTGGELIDIRPQQFQGAPCPAVPPAQPTTKPDAEAPLGLLQQIVAAINAVLAPAQQAVADLMVAVAGELGSLAGIALEPPGPGAAPALPAPQPLLAGVAKRPILVPVGTPLGGYLRPPVGGEYIGDDPAGELTDNVPAQADGCDPSAPQSCPPLVPLPDEARKAHSPYATYSPPSRGYYDSLIAKAVALYDGHDYVVMVKTDFIGMLDEVVQEVKEEVKARKGIDLGDGLIMSATHTHDGPGALANHSTRYFWLAMDLYQHDVYRRLIGQLADVVVAALDDLRPARIGHGNGLESPQTGNGNGINGYRRGRLASYAADDQPGCAFVPAAQCPAGIDDANELRKRIGILRVDDAATGVPLAVVINFADHGIAFDVENQYFSGDVLGAIEREVEQSYVQPAGDDGFRGPIALLVQNTGGDVTPKNVEYSIRGIEMLGKRMAPQVRAVTDAIVNFQDQPDLRAVSQRVILNRERLGYAEGEYPYAWGAVQCGNDIEVPFAGVGVNDIPGYGDTGLPRKHLYCIPAPPPDAADLADNGVAENGAFVPGDTILTAAQIGGITLLVQPGEPLTEYGVRALEMAQAEGFAPADTFVWGYAADHVGYILPPVEEDWATFGGAESTTTFWGWKQGQRFLDGHRELLRALRDGKAPPADEFQVNYDLYRPLYDQVPAAVPTPSAFPGAAVTQPADIKRFEKTQFVFEGGDPIVDLPHVTMLNGDGTPARRANGEIVDTFFEMHLKYRLVSGRHLWTVEFEAPKDWAAGTYRFKAAGTANQGAAVPYELESGNFAVAAATNLRAQDMACTDGRCSVRVTYTPVPMNYRIVDAQVAPGAAAPMRTGTVTFSNGTQTLAVAADGSGNFAATIGGTVTATAVDAWGNTAPAVTAGDPAPADADGDGVPDAADQCPNEAGPASNNGCPEQAAGGFPLCEPVSGDNYCLADIDEFLPVPVGGTIQGLVDTVYNTLTGGGGEPPPATGDVERIVADAARNAGTLPADLQASVEHTVANAQNGTLANRAAEAVVMEGRSFPDWSQPAALGLAKPYPYGVGGDGDPFTEPFDEFIGNYLPTGPLRTRDAHNGVMLYPPAGVPFAGLPTAAPVGEIAAYRRQDDRWVEIPVQVDERFPYFLANANSGFSFYSGTDMELTYAWDREMWKADGECEIDEASVAAMPDPVPGLDDDDEIVFMAADAGEPAAPGVSGPAGTVGGGQEIALTDPLDPSLPKFVYLFRQAGGSTFAAGHYVSYVRDANADQWVDRHFWSDADPEKLGTSNRGYGPNVSGTVCPDGTPASARAATDRFPRDGVTIATDKYKVYASGRWMVRNVHIAKPGADGEGVYGADIVDRWKGRAFQQSPDSVVSLVGFEDEQVNWEANSALLGERAGPVRAIREIWGADSGTNVTKTETYYRDAYAYRYRVRVHPIPPDGLYTSWDYNRSAMVPAPGEDVPGGRYYTVVRGAGVPIDGVNDDVGQIDRVQPVAGLCITSDGPQPAENYGGVCPLFFDMADPMLNVPLAMYNWEQISAKGDLGSLVYLFELKSATIGANAAAVPYYRDDACLDDGTGDDPVPRPWPGEAYNWNGGVVPKAYDQRAGRALDHSGNTPADCVERQGAHAQHGLHFFAPPESDNAMMPAPVDEIDGQQWAFAVPTERPTNVGEQYANIVRVPLVKVARPLPAGGGGASERGLMQVVTDFLGAAVAAAGMELGDAVVALIDGANTLVAGIGDLLFGNENASVVAVAEDIVYTPGDAPDDARAGASALLDGFTGQDSGRVRAGVGVVDMTPDVGYGAGQYSDPGPANYGFDPYLTGKKQSKSYGVVSRATGRAIVVEGANGKRIALLKSDNYLAQDSLMRRVAQILAEHGSTIGYDQILYGVTHAHSTSYYSTPAAGIWLFQDAFDARFFEFQARKLALAILLAERDLRPARMGATTVRHKVFKGQIMGPATGDDGTPVQYPREYGDLGLVVMRFDEVDGDGNVVGPLAAWINWGEHPEGLDGYDLHSADYVAFLERFVDRDLGAPMVFSQGDVGSAEKSGNTSQRIRDDGTVCEGPGAEGPACAEGEGVWRDWNHNGYVQNERNVRFLADAVVKGWRVIGGELPVDAPVAGIKPNNYVPAVQVPPSTVFPVDYRNAFVPGPLSHPYPSISNCRSEPTATGDPGAPILGLPDCQRGDTGGDPTGTLQMVWATMKAEGVPVPEHYDAPSFGTVEENARLKLQAFRLGDVVLGSCACEAQVDLILNFESRANDVAGDIYDGFDWACVAEDKGEIAADPEYAAACALQRDQYFDSREFPTHVPGSLADAAKVAHMRAQIHNDAAGWDAPEYVPYANAEPADPRLIKGNFTREELPPAQGYRLAVGVGHAGDYNGYTVSYREYMSHDHYRKALTAYGAHTADYMATRLVRMAGAMRGAPELKPELLEAVAQADEARMIAASTALGAVTKHAWEGYFAALPPDAAATTAPVQPRDVGLFEAATFTWTGGSTQFDNPRVVVERKVDGAWRFFADQSGEVQTRVNWPTLDQAPLVYAGQFEWRWTANFEAYEAFPARIGGTPPGTYRFVVEGCINAATAASLAGRAANLIAGILPQAVAELAGIEAQACRGGATRYVLASEDFDVLPQRALVAGATSDAVGTLTIAVAPTSIPKSYDSVFPYISTANDFGKFCRECSFRPWATSTAPVTSVTVTVDATGAAFSATGAGPTWTAAVGLADGASATIVASYADGQVSRPFRYTRQGTTELGPAGAPQL